MNSHLITALKLAFVAALMAFVFSNVQWTDVLVHTENVDTPQEAVTRTPGEILGPWDVEPVSFQVKTPSGALQPPENIVVGVNEAGVQVDVVPGFLTYWRNLDPWWFALGAACYFFSVLLAGSRWWWLLNVNGLGIRLMEAFRFTWIGVFFNNIVPGQTGGDLIKALYIMKRCPGKRVESIVSVIVDRVMGLASLAMLGAIVVLFAGEEFRVLKWSIWGVMAVVGMIGVVAFSRRVRRAIHLNELLDKLPGKLSGLLKQVDQAVTYYRNHKAGLMLWIVIGMVNHVISVASVLFMGLALGVGLPPFEYFVLIPVINIVSAVPIAPNGWGVGESMYQTLFSKFGARYVDAANPGAVMGTRGVALSVLHRLHMTFWSLLGGLFVLIGKDRVTKDDLEREMAAETESAEA